MYRNKLHIALMALLLTVACSVALLAMQYGRRGSWRRGDDRAGVPRWETDSKLPKDVFTFVRVRFSDGYGGYGGYGYRRGGKWATDYPDSDYNFSLRLHQLTAIKVNPDPVIMDLTDPAVFDYPFLYMIEPGSLLFSDQEVAALRTYLTNGGFMMVDDFWGDDEWFNFYRQMKRVFPDREPEDVPLEHEIFQCVYPLTEKPQVPSIHAFYGGRSWEGGRGDTRQPNYKAFSDDEGRIMVFICHNTDLGDGWEREGENHEYFQEYAVKKSYPLGINIVTYAMTH